MQPGHRASLDEDVTLVGALGGIEQLEEGGLARARCTGDEDELAGTHRKTEPAQSRAIGPIDLRDFAKLDHVRLNPTWDPLGFQPAAEAPHL